jgi:hypothetical protein
VTATGTHRHQKKVHTAQWLEAQMQHAIEKKQLHHDYYNFLIKAS